MQSAYTDWRLPLQRGVSLWASAPSGHICLWFDQFLTYTDMPHDQQLAARLQQRKCRTIHEVRKSSAIFLCFIIGSAIPNLELHLKCKQLEPKGWTQEIIFGWNHHTHHPKSPGNAFPFRTVPRPISGCQFNLSLYQVLELVNRHEHQEFLTSPDPRSSRLRVAALLYLSILSFQIRIR
jgi:hypothetical protein